MGDEEERQVTSARVEELSKVSHLIDYEKMECDVDVICNNFNERDQRCIHAVPLSSRSPKDNLICEGHNLFCKNNKYD